MKPILLAALALPLAFTGCATYVGADGGYGPGPGYGYAYDPGYYDGVVGDVGIYGYDRGYYHPHYHHYDGSYRGFVASRSFEHGSHVGGASHVAAAHVGGGGGASHAAASMGGGHAGGGGHGGGGHH